MSSSMVDVENPPEGEDQAIQQILSMMQQQYGKEYPPGVRPVRRFVHAKSHGCLQAEFIVEPRLPNELRFGLFQTGKTYPVWLRFSNGSAKPGPDTRKDVRAVAIKVMGVPGKKILDDECDAESQDFILANHPAAFIRNALDYVSFTASPLKFFFGLNPLKWRLRELKNLVQSMLEPITSPLDIQYWSQTPYQLGPHVVKYSVRPSRIDHPAARSGNKSPNYLRESMVEQLSGEEIRLDFLVHFRTNAERMPVEDPTIVWDCSLSPFDKVATIRIPMQTFDTRERDELGENLSFTPWHSLPEHRPLGGINRVRKAVYQALSRVRHQANGVPRSEPTA